MPIPPPAPSRSSLITPWARKTIPPPMRRSNAAQLANVGSPMGRSPRYASPAASPSPPPPRGPRAGARPAGVRGKLPAEGPPGEAHLHLLHVALVDLPQGPDGSGPLVAVEAAHGPRPPPHLQR